MKEDPKTQNNTAEREFKSPLLQELEERGFLKDCNDYKKLDEQLSGQQTSLTCYAGFDLTGKGLHAGHLMILMMMRCFLRHGHNVIALLGGGTTKIGDPSGKDKTRQILTADEIAINKAGIQEDIESILDKDGKFQPHTTKQGATQPINTNGEALNIEHDEIAQKYINKYLQGKAPKRGKVTIKDNDDWLSEIKYIDFLRDIGQYFSVNKMLSMDSVKTRLDRQQPFSFIEFNYALLQSYDFLQLTNENCTVQLGGSDQWGNIIHGINLIGKVKPSLKVFGITCPLIERSDGKKMGKSEGGSIWINQKLLSTHNYYNYFYNLPDENIEKFSKIFADVNITNNKDAEDFINSRANGVEILKHKTKLSLNACFIAHKTANYNTNNNAAKPNEEALNITQIADVALLNNSETLNTKLSDVIVKHKILPSKREFKQLMSQGAISISTTGDANTQAQPSPIKEDCNISEIHDKIECFSNNTNNKKSGIAGYFTIQIGKKKKTTVALGDLEFFKSNDIDPETYKR